METMIKRILVPIDFSDYSKSSLRYAIDYAQTFGAELLLVYVVEPIIYPPDFSMGQIGIPSMDAEMDKRAVDQLSSLARTEIPEGVRCRTIVKTGKPFIEIIDTAKEENVDLIIIASHGHTGVEHLLFGSTADKVIKKAPCPVLSLREPIKGFDYKGQLSK